MFYFYLVLLFFTGSCLCSFTCLVGMRIPNNQSIIQPQSHCDICKHTLAWFELIPVLGFLINCGNCRYCHAKIHWYLPCNELLLGSSLIYLFILRPDAFFKITIVFILFLFATMDYFHGVILPIFLIPSFFILFVLHPEISMINFLAVFICLSSFSILSKGFGFGDVEILSFMSLFISLYNLLLILLLSSLICLIIEIAKQNFENSIKFVPYIYLATIIVFLWK